MEYCSSYIYYRAAIIQVENTCTDWRQKNTWAGASNNIKKDSACRPTSKEIKLVFLVTKGEDKGNFCLKSNQYEGTQSVQVPWHIHYHSYPHENISFRNKQRLAMTQKKPVIKGAASLLKPQPL